MTSTTFGRCAINIIAVILTTDAQVGLLATIATDLNASLAAEDRHRRLVEVLFRSLPCDAAVILRLEGETLVPIATAGLLPEAMGMRFALREHPRLDVLAKATEPVRFPADCDLPDPFDGLLEGAPQALHEVHACLGAPLHAEGQLLGVLTLDALDPGAFEGFPQRLLAALGELAAAALRTGMLIDELESRAKKSVALAREVEREVRQRRGGELIGTSGTIRRLREEITLVAPADLPVLVTGETGTGKELVARGIHSASRRSDEALIYVNCAALPEPVAESELFGHARGAFTGADQERPGKFEVADGGTLFLDEIGELPPAVQPKLLRALQEGEVQRVGEDRPRHVDVRVIAATNRDLEAEVRRGRFPADLFHRLNVYRIVVPPLREHAEDVPVLAGFFADLARRRFGTARVRLAPNAHAALSHYSWPGNVRELENVVQRAVLRASQRTPPGEPLLVLPEDLGLAAPQTGEAPTATGPAPPASQAADLAVWLPRGRRLVEAVDEFKRELILRAVRECSGNWSAAARRLGMDRGNLHHLARRLGLR